MQGIIHHRDTEDTELFYFFFNREILIEENQLFLRNKWYHIIFQDYP